MPTISPDVPAPALEADFAVSEMTRRAIVHHVLGLGCLDHLREFTVVDGEDPRRATRVHLFAERPVESVNHAPYPWSGQAGLDLDPWVLIEDHLGHRHPLQGVRPACQSVHVYGMLLEVDGERWLVHSKDQVPGQLIDEAKVTLDKMNFVKIHAASAQAVNQIGPLEDLANAVDGEFLYSLENEAVLVACPWISDMAQEHGNRDAEARALRVIEEASDIIRAISAAPEPV